MRNTYSVRSQNVCSRSWFVEPASTRWRSHGRPTPLGKPSDTQSGNVALAQWTIPLGATWVDYVPEVNERIESDARRGEMLFEIYFQTNNTIYQFELVKLVQRNATSGFERPIRRVFVPMPSRL